MEGEKKTKMKKKEIKVEYFKKMWGAGVELEEGEERRKKKHIGERREEKKQGEKNRAKREKRIKITRSRAKKCK